MAQVPSNAVPAGKDSSGFPLYTLPGANVSADNVFRLAGTLGSLFSSKSNSIDDYIKEATKVLRKQSRKTTKKIDERISNIYPELTGLTGQEAREGAYGRLDAATGRYTTLGREDLATRPDIGAEYDRLNTRVQDIQNQYSLANLLGGYENIALNPPVVSMDVNSIRNTADWVDPTTNQVQGKYKALYDYSDPQTQRFLYGNRNTADAIGRYYNTSGDVAGLMNYGSVG
jgi:hypothetical protein